MTSKRLIFTVTTGRSGTMLLSSLLRLLQNTDCFHEPGNLFNQHFRKVLKSKVAGTEFWKTIKLPEINNYPGNVYIETSHFFCKGFLEPLLELQVIPDLIVLRREKRAVAKSLMRLNTVPGRTPEGIENYLSPSVAGVLRFPDWEKATDYQLCYWYCLEIERRQFYYSRLVKKLGGKVVKISFEDLTKIRFSVPYLRKELDLPPLSAIGKAKYLYKILNPKPLNQKKEFIVNPDVDVDFAGEEQEVINKVIAANAMLFPEYTEGKIKSLPKMQQGFLESF